MHPTRKLLPRRSIARCLTIATALSAIAHAAAIPSAELRRLYDEHDWFALRSSVDARSPAFFRGAVAVAFHDVRAAEDALTAAIAEVPDSDDAWDARHLLVSLAFRTGDHHAAVSRLSPPCE